MYTDELFNWNDTKNLKLQNERGLSFEDVLDSIENDKFYGVFSNPSGNFKNQKVLLVVINNYPCIVPFVETETEIFLKTIIPDRRFKKFIDGERDE